MRARLGALVWLVASVPSAARAQALASREVAGSSLELELIGCGEIPAADVRRIIATETRGAGPADAARSEPLRIDVHCTREGEVLDVHIRATSGGVVREREGRFHGTAAERARFVGLAASELIFTMRAAEPTALGDPPPAPPMPPARPAPLPPVPTTNGDGPAVDEPSTPARSTEAPPPARFRLGLGFGGRATLGDEGVLLFGGRAAGGVLLGSSFVLTLDGTYHRGGASRRSGTIDVDAVTVGLGGAAHVIGTRDTVTRLTWGAGLRGGSFGVQGETTSTFVVAASGRRFGFGPTTSVELAMLHPIEITLLVEAGYLAGGVRALIVGEDAVRTTGAYLAFHFGIGVRSER